MPKVKVDENECTGCGLCYNDECADVFVEGSDGISEVRPSYQKGDVHQGEIPDDKKECAQKAADACPVTAITVE
jgi:ferredoxin